MQIHLMPQKSPEWFAVRKLKLTASHAQEIAACGKGLDTYVNNIVADAIAQKEDEKYSNFDMERGKDMEDEARTIYELETGNEVKEVGFIELNESVGISPDGIVGDDGGVEIKRHDNNVFTKLVCSGDIDSKYEWQIYMSLFVTGRKWWDYVAYNPNYRRSIYIKRIYPDTEKFAKLQKGIEIGILKTKEHFEKMNKFIKQEA